MEWSLILIAAMDAIAFTAIMVMLSLGFRMLREIQQTAEQTHALTAKASAALDNVSRLVVYAGGRAPTPES